MSTGRLFARCLSWIAAVSLAFANGIIAAEAALANTWPERPVRIGMAAHGTTSIQSAAILDKQRTKWAAIAHDHGIKPVH